MFTHAYWGTPHWGGEYWPPGGAPAIVVRGDDAFKSDFTKNWIRQRANTLLDEKLNALVTAVKAAKPRSKRKRKITAARHRLEDVHSAIVEASAPADVLHSLEMIHAALSEAVSAGKEFAELKAEVIRHARHIQQEAKRARRRRDDEAIVLLL